MSTATAIKTTPLPTTITLDDLITRGGGTPDDQRPVVFTGAQFNATSTYITDPVSSKKAFCDVIDSQFEMIENSEVLHDVTLVEAKVAMVRLLRAVAAQ